MLHGQVVWVRSFWDGPRWKKAVVCDQLGAVTYLVQLEGGELRCRHIDQIRTGVGIKPTSLSHEEKDVSLSFPEASKLPEIEEGSQNAELYSQVEDSTNPDASEPGGTTSVEQERELEPEVERRNASSSRYPTRSRRPPERLYGTLDT